MLHLFLGNLIVALFVLLGLSNAISGGHQNFLMLLGALVVLEFIPVLPYLLGRKLSKHKEFEKATLVVIGILIGVFIHIFIPNFVPVAGVQQSTVLIAALLFFMVAFLPPSIEFWKRHKSL